MESPILRELDFDCTVVKNTFNFTTLTQTLYGRNGEVVSRGTQMTECGGNAICKKFASRHMFMGRDSFGCPCHESLKRG